LSDTVNELNGLSFSYFYLLRHLGVEVSYGI